MSMTALTASLQGVLIHNEPLAKYTTWRVGGPAKQLYKPANRYDLVEFLQQLPENEPLLFIGLGSNLLIRDGGFNGTVIAMHGCLTTKKYIAPNQVFLESGVASVHASRFFAKLGLAGGEFLGSIPGTIGGALAMNAGCYGSETWQLVTEVETINRYGQISSRSADQFKIGYRSVTAPDAEWFISTTLQLQPGNSSEIAQRSKELWQLRGKSQPTKQANAGSVFRNPEGNYAAKLIEAAGLKGATIGDASVSTKHANFIVNNGQATASDIEQLIHKVQQQVQQQHRIQLQPEVRIIGEKIGGSR